MTPRSLARARRIGGRPAASTPPPVPTDDGQPPLAAEVARPSKAGRNLPAAIGVGLGLGALIVASLFLYRPSFAVLVALASGFGSFELSRAIGTAKVRVVLVPVLLGGTATLVATWLRGPQGLVAGVLVSALAVLVWRLGDGAHRYLDDVGASLFVLLYVPALAGFAVLSVHADDGAARILAFAATVVCSDTGGYATGVLFGRHPLAPIVSKAKTWEGFAGSVLFCCIAGVLFLTLTFHQAWWTGLLFGLGIVVTATLGDLGESVIKRDLGVKDMSHLLPGHGGLMDRLDSMLPCAAVAYLLLSAFAPV
ncbi:MAG TPA: phosphatidate cytidylyltransferase [Jatrophihabitans sp.]